MRSERRIDNSLSDAEEVFQGRVTGVGLEVRKGPKLSKGLSCTPYSLTLTVSAVSHEEPNGLGSLGSVIVTGSWGANLANLANLSIGGSLIQS